MRPTQDRLVFLSDRSFPFPHTLERHGWPGIRLLQVHTPIAQCFQRNEGARSRAPDIRARRHDAKIAIEILEYGGVATEIPLKPVHGSRIYSQK